MNKKDWVEGLLFAGLRLMGVGCALAGMLNVVFALLDSWDKFDPNYLGTYLAATLLRPVLVLLAGLMLCALAPRMAHRMAGRFSHPTT